MAHEVTPWKAPGLAIALRIGKLSDREPYSKEINVAYGEGGALNANYTTVDAAAKAANILGLAGLRYGEHLVFKTGGVDMISVGVTDVIHFDFRDEEAKAVAERALAPYLY